MAKKSSIERNEKRKKLAKKFDNKRKKLKAIINDKTITIEDRFMASLNLSKLKRNSSKVRVRNRCLLTGRPRAYYRKFEISRIALRDLASIGALPGLTKSSW